MNKINILIQYYYLNLIQLIDYGDKINIEKINPKPLKKETENKIAKKFEEVLPDKKDSEEKDKKPETADKKEEVKKEKIVKKENKDEVKKGE